MFTSFVSPGIPWDALRPHGDFQATPWGRPGDASGTARDHRGFPGDLLRPLRTPSDGFIMYTSRIQAIPSSQYRHGAEATDPKLVTVCYSEYGRVIEGGGGRREVQPGPFWSLLRCSQASFPPAKPKPTSGATCISTVNTESLKSLCTELLSTYRKQCIREALHFSMLYFLQARNSTVCASARLRHVHMYMYIYIHRRGNRS